MTLQEHLHSRSNRLSLEYKLYHILGNAGKHDVISKDNSNNNTVIVLILQQCNFVASLLVAVGWLNKIIYLWLSDWVAANQLHRESKKTRHQTLGHNFTNYYPIFNLFSLLDSEENL